MAESYLEGQEAHPALRRPPHRPVRRRRPLRRRAGGDRRRRRRARSSRSTLDDEAKANFQVRSTRSRNCWSPARAIDGSLAWRLTASGASSNEHSRQRNTKVITQGMTGETGTFHTAAGARLRHADGRRRHARARAAQTHIGLPVFDTVAEAVAATGADRQRDLRAAALRRGFDPRGDRRRGAADRRASPRAFRCSTWCGSSARCPAPSRG